MPIDRERIASDFAKVVNMTADELEKWLHTPESLHVGWKGALGPRQSHSSAQLIAATRTQDSYEVGSMGVSRKQAAA